MKLPTAGRIDRRLVGGGLLFGIGWGIAGFCPGPALVALGMGEAKAVVFVAAMLARHGPVRTAGAQEAAPAPARVKSAGKTQLLPGGHKIRLNQSSDRPADSSASAAAARANSAVISVSFFSTVELAS